MNPGPSGQSKVRDSRTGYLDGSVQASYSRISVEMRSRLLEGLAELWGDALDQRLRYSDSSPVGVLDASLRECR
jgi:hypothetical protein